MDEDDFYLKVAHALSGCQLVEQELKLYITKALDLAKKCIGDKMSFKIRAILGVMQLFFLVHIFALQYYGGRS